MDKYYYLIDGDELCYRVALANQKAYYYVMKDDLTVASNFKYKQDAIEFVLNDDSLMIYKASTSPLQKLTKEERAVIFTREFNLRVKEILNNFKVYPPCGYDVFVTGSENFRKDIATLRPYKGHRIEKPLFIEEIRELLVIDRLAEQNRYLEADDLLAITSGTVAEKGYIPIICSSDKDLATVPGLLYNLSRKTITEINTLEAQYNFYYQVLVGDDVDNIPHPTGLGEIQANKVLAVCQAKGLSGVELHNTIRVVYEEFLLRKKKDGSYQTKWFNDTLSVDDVFKEICNLLHMRRTQDMEEVYDVKEVWKL